MGVGASAGGLEAFTALLKHLPPDTGMAFVLVQHLDPLHDSALAQLLARATPMPVREIASNTRVRANHIYVIPPNTDLSISRGILALRPRERTDGRNRSIDLFLESLAKDQGESAIGVILSGTASDGTLGLEAIKAEGGITFAQDDTARHVSMPRSAVAAGCVDLVLAPEGIAKELERIARHPFLTRQRSEHTAAPAGNGASATRHLPDGAPRPPRAPSGASRPVRAKGASQLALPASETTFKKILLLLRDRTGVDFSVYKPATLQRRIARRMVLTKHEDPREYVAFLRSHRDEIDALYRDALINVTGFFRNGEAFEVLKNTVFSKALQRRGDQPYRVWVLGCSTGEEAYSIAMAFMEASDNAPHARRLQVFATDLNEALLGRARHGLYARHLVQDVSSERLRRFFVEEEGGYRINKSIREMVVFARQNLLSDPPFSRLDLISCRNVLIYLDQGVQKRVFPTFHFSLKSDGVLFLGASESIGGFSHLFEPLDRKHKLYVRKAAATPALHVPLIGPDPDRPAAAIRHPLRQAQAGAVRITSSSELDAERAADRVSVRHFAPPGVLINADLQILQFRGATGAYLEPPTGKASFDLLKMARPGLMLPLRTLVNQARRENRVARKENVRVTQHGRSHAVTVEVIPLRNLREPCFLVLFLDGERAGARRAGTTLRKPALRANARTARSQDRATARRVAELEAELAETREYLQSLKEQHDAANEELQSANEEVQSANEELQSVNEELETSKEELESANEELTTVNEEMTHRNEVLNRLNNDLVNLQSSMQVAVVLLNRDLTVRRFTEGAALRFDLLAADVGRPLSSVRHRLVAQAHPSASELPAPTLESPPDLAGIAADVIAAVRVHESEVRDQAGHWYSLRVHPYLTVENKVDGAVLMLVDIDLLKRNERAIAAARDYAQSALDTVREPMLVLDEHLSVESANRSYYHVYQVSAAEVVGRSIFSLEGGQWDIPALRAALQEILPRNATVDDFLVEQVSVGALGRRDVVLNARPIENLSTGARRILLAIDDVTDRRRVETELREADRRKNEFLALLAHELRNPLAPISNAVQILRLREPAQDDVVGTAMDMIERQVRQMVLLVDDLLDISRISRGTVRLRPEQLDLGTEVNRAAETFRPACEQLGIELSVSVAPQPLHVSADPTRLAQILGNLLNNACKFTPRGGRISVGADLDDDEAVVRVRDTGVGLAPDQLDRIFEMFVQVDTSPDRSARGLGIGLALVDNLVRLHGGTVEAQSAGPGQGAEFVVRLPLVRGPLPQKAKGLGEADLTVTGRRVLVVDDNADEAESLAILLRLGGNETRTVHDGREALDAVAEFRPEVILLDIGLPGVSGHDVARRIRREPWGQDVVLVALTGFGQDADRIRSREAGFDGHLVKPYSESSLAALLRAGRRPAARLEDDLAAAGDGAASRSHGDPNP